MATDSEEGWSALIKGLTCCSCDSNGFLTITGEGVEDSLAVFEDPSGGPNLAVEPGEGAFSTTVLICGSSLARYMGDFCSSGGD